MPLILRTIIPGLLIASATLVFINFFPVTRTVNAALQRRASESLPPTNSVGHPALEMAQFDFSKPFNPEKVALGEVRYFDKRLFQMVGEEEVCYEVRGGILSCGCCARRLDTSCASVDPG